MKIESKGNLQVIFIVVVTIKQLKMTVAIRGVLAKLWENC